MTKPITQNLVWDRSTPGTHLYKAPNQESALIKNIYISKQAFNEPPAVIVLTITTEEEQPSEVKAEAA